MIEMLPIFLRIAGIGLIALAVAHVPISRHLNWREDVAHLTPVNASIFHVHNFFICLVLVLMGLPCALDPQVFLEKSRAAAWVSWSIATFWAIRLYCQWFVYRANLWRGKRMETTMHWSFTLIWLGLTTLFGLCAAVQMDWLAVPISP